MSYCRFSSGDVYLYPSITGGIVCCGCKMKHSNNVVFFSRSEAIKHLELHKEQGHKVPDYAIKRLEYEIEEAGDEVE